MCRYRNDLPQIKENAGVFLTDGGLETDLIFNHGFDLPEFASFPLALEDKGRAALTSYFDGYIKIAEQEGCGFVLEAPTWRANKDWAAKLGFDAASLATANQKNIALMKEIRAKHKSSAIPIVISGCIGPRGDGYNPDAFMSPEEAQAYHSEQIKTLSEAGVDMLGVLTMCYAEEAIGITRAANAASVPVMISFTVETDGRLPSGQTLEDAISQVDRETDCGPAYYGINCAHPDHFESVVTRGGDWTKRIKALRSNASRLSHAELDEAEELDDGNPVEFGDLNRQLREALPHLTVLGGCCGTDHRHISETGRAC